MVWCIRVRDQATAAVERLYAAAQECRGDMTSFSQSQKRVVAGEAKKLPEALASIQARLKDAEEMVVENEKSARENEVCMCALCLTQAGSSSMPRMSSTTYAACSSYSNAVNMVSHD